MNNVVETLLLIINLLKNQALTLDIFICTKSWYLCTATKFDAAMSGFDLTENLYHTFRN